jgi:hypothetical protein
MTQVTNEQKVEFTRVNSDINGNPRFVCHFLAFINDADKRKADESKTDIFGINTLYEIALRKSRQLGGKKFHNKQYGGGIVFQMYSGEQEEMSRRILEIKNTK